MAEHNKHMTYEQAPHAVHSGVAFEQAPMPDAEHKPQKSNAFVQGFALAVALLADHYDAPSVAADICRQCGYGPGDFERAKVDGHDLAALRRAMRNEAGWDMWTAKEG